MGDIARDAQPQAAALLIAARQTEMRLEYMLQPLFRHARPFVIDMQHKGQRVVLDLPRETQDATGEMRRVVSDRIKALGELTTLVARTDRGVDVARPSAAPPAPAPVAPAKAPVAPAAVAPARTPAAAAPKPGRP